MKKLLLTTAVIVLGVVSSWAQGTVNFANATAQIDAPDFVKIGSAAQVAATGPTYAAQLYIAANGTVDPTAFVAVGSPVPYSTGVDAGYFFGGAVATSFASGTQVAVQVRAFNTTQGANYQAASSAPSAQLGQSNIIQNYTLGGQTPPASLIGLQSFTITAAVVPEPSTIALGVIGAAALLLRRRRA